MTFYEWINRLCRQRGLTVTKMARDLGFSASAGTTWKKLKGDVRPSTIKKIADYLGMTIDEFESGFDSIDYSKVDTSDFNQNVWQKLLEDHGYDEPAAIKAYFAFEKAQAKDAAMDSQTIHNSGSNYGMIGNAHAPVKIVNGTEHTLSDQESELLRIFADLSVVEQSKVLIYASELKEGTGK